jgi:hypothetical protein
VHISPQNHPDYIIIAQKIYQTSGITRTSASSTDQPTLYKNKQSKFTHKEETTIFMQAMMVHQAFLGTYLSGACLSATGALVLSQVA